MNADRYYVLWPDGQRFGPADIQTLQRWVVENRVGPATLLEDAASGRHVRATDIAALQPVLNLPLYGPQAGFVPANPSTGVTEVRLAWILGAAGLLGMFCIGPLPAVAGIVMAAIALSKKQPNAAGALAFNIVVLVVAAGLFGVLSLF